MANNNKILVPEARKALDQLKADVMKAQGYNGKLTSEQVGKIGGPIGGNMVKEMVRMAQEKIVKK